MYHAARQAFILDSEVDTLARENMEKKVELAWLMAFYGGLLTEKQRQVLSMHCEEDLSFSEIAQETGVSRQGVHDMLERTADKLFDLEDKLALASRFRRMQDGLTDCLNALETGNSDQARALLRQLISLNQEDEYGL